MFAAVAHLAVLLTLTLGPAVWPLDPQPQVVEPFSAPAAEWGPGHRGVDLLGYPGQPVHAAQAGTVTFAGMLAGRGVLVVSHGSTRTTYEPVSASVRVGDAVHAGERIGILQQSPLNHCWPRTCLHWGLIEGETYLDPLTLVGGGPIRLLPLYRDLPVRGGSLAANAVAVGPLLTDRWSSAPAAPVGFARRAGGPGGTPGAAGPW